MLPRPTRPPAPPFAPREHGPGAPSTYDAIKARLLAKLEERFDLSTSKRMPQSILRHTLRQQAEQLAESDARALPRPDRDRLIDEVFAELFGYGPLEELFAEPGVREVMVTGPGAVIARREQGQWLPTSVQFRDEAHVRAVLDRIAAHADAVGPVMASVGAFDMKLPNGFRALAVIPPGALGHPATAAFVREAPAPALPKEAGAAPASSPTASTSHGTLKTVPAPSRPRMPGSGLSGLTTTPTPRPVPTESGAAPAPPAPDPLARHRNRILERLLKKFASAGLYDVGRLDPNELRRIVTAYVTEYGEAERIYISDTDQGRLTLEILAALRK
jgi:hypothetical protein